ncbi:MAG TPA: division/cell wall cluster transcriptional repressor MraZ [Ignavibacteriaceae bacterium]|nr:division/cell wall cluster transcriptional repressor MraZ [Ignavibacteriaceae bacterium]
MFRGQFKYSIDAKQRLAIPAKFRKAMPDAPLDSIVMTIGKNQCIEIYTFDYWKDVKEKEIELLDQNDPMTLMYIRKLTQYTHDLTLDSQSRVIIPQALLNHAKIKKEVVIQGVIDRMEVWDPDVYDAYMGSSDLPIEELGRLAKKK